ncbi:hypothetical protein M378DRAFT_160486 [Amanita muscaria Koide BX008]|uniref:Cytochrome P450 n=1 Tax=Amanita muscaria (strain Koide BX008) TaxID=946122 RepID=A0A0C2XC40_AMAMK|nr:hypothetical protein M378DRAFT_160486 [Amanita muscaria Koide BX008]
MPLFKLLGFQNTTGMLHYGSEWRKHRREMEEGLKKDTLLYYHHVFTEKVHLLLGEFLHEPAGFQDHCGMLGISVTMAVSYGYNVTGGLEDPFVKAAEFAVKTAAHLAIPGRTLLLVFGFLGYIPPWFPGASTQRLCAEVREAILWTRLGAFQYVKDKMRVGTSRNCVLSRLLERHSGDDGSYGDEEMLKDVMLSFYIGGVETMKATTASFILAMTLHPRAQRKAQEEIDRVLGSRRLPCFEDRASLPYVEALYREVHRWRPVLPAGLPHATTSDDTYKGYYIPKGTIVMPNVWAITRNEDKHPDPELFQPERFFNTDGTLNDETVNYSFGFGRRLCPGRHMADKVVWLMIVSVLATFKISKARDENGDEIDVDANAYGDGVTSHPLPFKCSIVPRTPESESLVHNAAAAARQNLAEE